MILSRKTSDITHKCYSVDTNHDSLHELGKDISNADKDDVIVIMTMGDEIMDASDSKRSLPGKSVSSLIRLKGLYLYTVCILCNVDCCIRLTALVFFDHTL